MTPNLNAANRLTTITHQNSAGTVLASDAYTLDAAGRLTSEARAWGSSTDTLTYSYTNDDQLTGVTHSNSSFAAETFGFDANGNRNTSGYATGAGNQTTSDGTYTYAYDAEGNLVSRTAIAGGNTTTYSWDTRNRLTSVVQTVGGTTTTTAYTYDALNRLIKVAVNGTTTRETLYDGQTPLLDFNASGAVTARYLSVPGAIDELLARQTASGVAWYLDDREGTVRDIINNSGASIDHLDYSAFGNLTAQSAPANGDRFGYAGMEADTNTGLYYDRARWYDPSGGKFVSQDPLGFPESEANNYRYSANSPVNYVDVNGNELSPLGWSGSFVPPGQSVQPRNAGTLPNSNGSSPINRSSGLPPGVKPLTGPRPVDNRSRWDKFWNPFTGPYVSEPIWDPFNPIAMGAGEVVCGAVPFIPNGGSRGIGNFRPFTGDKFNPAATGAHSVWSRNGTTGSISGYQSFYPNTNPRYPNPFAPGVRCDVSGKPDYNKITKQYVPTPHMHDSDAPGGVRPADPTEIPK